MKSKNQFWCLSKYWTYIFKLHHFDFFYTISLLVNHGQQDRSFTQNWLKNRPQPVIKTGHMDTTSPTSNCHDKYNGEKYVASKKTITAEIYSRPNNGIIHTTDDIIFKNLIQTKHHKHFKWGFHCWWQIIFVWNSQKKTTVPLYQAL